MSEAPPDHTTLLAYTFATWVFELHQAGIPADDPEVAAACEAIVQASGREATDQAGGALVERIRSLLADDGPDAVQQAARKLFGDRIGSDMGQGERAERIARIRKYQFARSLPWLARIWERSNGTVRPSWLLVERVTDQVAAMDPNPWNDIDEERRIPVSDFQVLWELDDCAAIHVR